MKKIYVIIVFFLFAFNIFPVAFNHFKNVPSSVSAAHTWYDEDWTYRKKITIDGTLVNHTVTNFPFLIYNSSDSDLSSYAQADGNDIIFVSSGGTKLAHELDYYSNGKFSAWVNLSLTKDTDYELYMYYGNSGASAQENPSGVWDSDYKCVYHFSEGSGTTVQDSTANNNDSYYNGSLPTISLSNQRMGYRQYLDGDNDWIYLPNSLHIQNEGHIMVVARASNHQSGVTEMLWRDMNTNLNYLSISPYSNDKWEIRSEKNGASGFLWQTNKKVKDELIYIAANFKDSGEMNATMNNTYYQDLTAEVHSAPADSKQGIGVNIDNEQNDFTGYIDEFRLSSVPRTGEWLNMTYNTMFLDMLSFGTNYRYLPSNPTNVASVIYGNTNINITWTEATDADTTMLRYKANSYPTSETDGTELYNGTNEYYNHTSFVNTYFYTLFSYNDTDKLYSSGAEVPTGSLTINVYSETDGSTLSNWNLQVTSQDGETTYSKDTNTNPQVLTVSDLPTGNNVQIEINLSGYKNAYYYLDLISTEQYTLNAYLTPVADTHIYYIQVIDNANNPVSDATVQVKHYINSSVGFENVSTLVTDGNGQVSLWMTESDNYLVEISKDDFDTTYSPFIPDPDYYGIYYPKVFVIVPTDEDYKNETTYLDAITFNGYLSENTIYVNFTDTLELTTDTHIYLYEIDYNTGERSVVDSDLRTGDNDFQCIFLGINSSNDHQVVLHLNHTEFGHVIDQFTLAREDRNLTSKTFFDNLMELNYGTSPGGFGWSNIFGFFMLLACLFMFGERNAGVALLLSGFMLGFLNVVVGLTVIAVMIPALFVTLGLLVMWSNSRREYR